ncbi:hypothetical protein [Reichenbachiella sp. MALMAid0571]|uniref:capsule assembly Wzi family protein n=1 Tax=Reichenbachiella sp. MALMAid0571 TaxID=3143939 RepID=UPI0032E04410
MSFLNFWTKAQSTYAPLNADYYYLIDRYQVLNSDLSQNQIHSSFKPYKRKSIADFIDSLEYNTSSFDEANIKYLKTDNWEYFKNGDEDSEKPFLKVFYKKKPDFVHVDTKDFDLHVKPVLYFSTGHDANSTSSPYINSRGVELRGKIDNKISFYTFLTENQAVFPKYVQDYSSSRGIVPNEGFWKLFGGNGYDFFTARGYIQFNATKHIGIQFGHDRNFVGNGYRSMLLSDISASYPFIKIQTKIWKLQYTNLYAELTADAPYTATGSLGTKEFPKKFMTLHHLSINVSKKLNLGIFESVIFHRGDSTGTAIEFNYLNPVIFYSTIEQQTGSPDNALLGFDFKWNAKKGVSFYGQFILDELIVGELKSGRGWWGNKYAYQLGGKYYDAFKIPHLDLQAEYNYARPFTYSHESIFTNYTQYRQPLAHPLGANFKEKIFIARYQPLKKVYLTGKVIQADYGTDPEGENFGSDVLKSYNSRIDNVRSNTDYGYNTGDGVSNKLLFVDLTVSYRLKHNLFVDLRHVYRKMESESSINNFNTQFSSLSLRLNIAARDYSF